MTISTRLWLSAAVSIVALFAFCATLILKLHATTGAVGITVVGAAFVSVVIIATTIVALRAFQSRLSRLQRAFEYTGQLEGTHGLIESDEPDFAKVADAFNDMAIRLSVEAVRRNEAEQTLMAKAQEIQAHSQRLNSVRRMADRLQSCTDESEFCAVISTFAPQLMHGRGGMLYLLSESHNLLQVGSTWNDPDTSAAEFTPAECWGLRRGQEHLSGEGQAEVTCAHVKQIEGKTHRCLPLIAQSETVGLLYLEGSAGEVIERRAGAEGVTYMLRETVALGLVNLRLREKLRTQSVRDPLTGLYNRRYLDESLELELARAKRSGDPITAIMVDIDHFKTFNDTFGHDAGDFVLKIVADILARSMRKGDVPGRFGGEEFLLLMPGTDKQHGAERAEKMRQVIAGLDVGYAGRKLGRITASFGVAAYPADAESGQSLLQAADNSLYAAKESGRDRVVASAING